MEYEKDCSLLRPFDLEVAAAKRGEVVWSATGGDVAYIAGPNHLESIVVQWPDGRFSITTISNLSMKPLCWVEGKPVYKGDLLWWKPHPASPCIAEKIMDSGFLAYRSSNNEPCGVVHPGGLTWTKPKVKREGWVNICPPNYSRESASCGCGSIYISKEIADEYRTIDRIACVRIEWEEPAI